MASHLNFIKQLDHKPNRERFAIIKQRLDDTGVEFSEQQYGTGVNLIVDLGEGKKRIGIGSHFDRIKEAGGANDNGSAIAVCFDIIEKHLTIPAAGPALRIFFFDEEETGLQGSSAYVKAFGTADLMGLINMELVGLGNRFALWPLQKEAQGTLLETFESVAAEKKIASSRFDKIVTNTADHVHFRNAGLADSFTVTCISMRDVEIAQSYYTALNSGVDREELFAILSKAPIFEHYHKPTDTFETITDTTVAMTSEVIWKTISKIQEPDGSSL